jgi:hypothetical protein
MAMGFLAVLLAAATSVAKPSLTVVVRGAPPQTVSAALASRADEVELRVEPAPNAPSAPAPHQSLPEERIAAARKAYVSADFSHCLEQVDDDAVVYDALAEQQRAMAALVLLWRAACEVGANRLPAAQRAALELAVLHLEVPPEVGQVSPEVEAVLAKAQKQAAQLAPARLEVTASGDAAVELDGRPAGCTTPCTLDVLEGSHVVRVTEEGKEPAMRPVRVEGKKATAAFELQPAAPELAAAQWTARYAQSADFDGPRSAKLLSTALRTSRLVMLTVEEGRSGRQQALLAVDGAVTARAERNGALASELPGLLDDLLVRGQLVEATPLYKRPLFWIAVVGAAVIAGTVTALVATKRMVGEVHFQ